MIMNCSGGAADALEKIGDKRTIEPVIQALKDDRDSVDIFLQTLLERVEIKSSRTTNSGSSEG